MIQRITMTAGDRCAEDARKNFKRQPYKSVDVAKYIAKKFGIGGDADGQKDS